MIRLSIVIPSRRPDLTAYARILQACSWAGPRVEIVVRDTSGNAAKAAFLRGIEHENCCLFVAPSGDGDLTDALAAAQGDFVCVLGDDDLCFDRALATLPGIIESVAADTSVIGVAAPVLMETAEGAQALAYPNIDADDALVRLSGYLSAQGPSLLLSAPVRRTTMTWALDIVGKKPFAFPFDDLLTSMLYLVSGKFARMTRLMLVHDAAGDEAARRAGLAFYQQGRIDPATDKLHWFLCGFEGATLIRNVALPQSYSPQQRQAMADLWFSAMFARFRSDARSAYGSPLAAEADKLCARWNEAAGRLSFADLLADICQFLALTSQENALAYFAFWSTILGLRQAGAA